MDGNTGTSHSRPTLASRVVHMAASPTVTLAELNAASAQAFVGLLGSIVEHSPWIAERCLAARPFTSIEDVRLAILSQLGALRSDALDDLFRLHPELAGAEAVAGAMTADSMTEQGRLGLTSLDSTQLKLLNELNAAYRAKFGFPCIIALRLHDSLDSVLQAFGQRIDASLAEARRDNLREIGEIIRGRLARLISTQAQPASVVGAGGAAAVATYRGS